MPSRKGSSITIRDVAEAAGVSRGAVSKVLCNAYGVSPEMKARVQTVIDELGYRPSVSARGMRGSTYTLGVEIPNISNPFFPKIINGAKAALAGSRYKLIIVPAGPDNDEGTEAIEVLADRQVDGIVAISSQLPPAWLEDLGQETPLVMLGRHDPSVSYDTLVGDDLLGASLAVQHLYDLGHRRIVHLTQAQHGAAALPGTPHGVRLIGYLDAMQRLGLKPETVTVEPSQASAHDGAMRLLSDLREPVGIFAAFDELALGVLEAVGELDLDPAQASVLGYDDTEIAAHPLMSLTSVNQSGTQMGEISVRLLLERIAGRSVAVHEVITPRVIARRSTSAPGPARSS